MSTPYQRGAAFEHRVKAELEKESWRVWRTPGSKSPCDLIAIKPAGLPPATRSWVRLVQCKLRGAISAKERCGFVADATALGAVPILAYQLPNGKLVHYKNLLTGESWTP